MRMIGTSTGRTSWVLVMALALLPACSDNPPSGAVSDSALDVLRIAVLNTVEALGHDRLQPEERVIQRDFLPPARDVLREHGLDGPAVARQLATDLGYRTVVRDEVVSCVDDRGSEVTHACKLTFDGVLYSPMLIRLSEESASVAVHFMGGPGNAAGTRIVDLARTPEGWTVVNVSNVAI